MNQNEEILSENSDAAENLAASMDKVDGLNENNQESQVLKLQAELPEDALQQFAALTQLLLFQLDLPLRHPWPHIQAESEELLLKR